MGNTDINFGDRLAWAEPNPQWPELGGRAELLDLNKHSDRFQPARFMPRQVSSTTFDPVGRTPDTASKTIRDVLQGMAARLPEVRSEGHGGSDIERSRADAALTAAVEATAKGHLFDFGSADGLADITNSGVLADPKVTDSLRLPYPVTPITIRAGAQPMLFILRGDEAGHLEQVSVALLRTLDNGTMALSTIALLEYAEMADDTLGLVMVGNTDQDDVWMMAMHGNAARTLLLLNDDRLRAIRITHAEKLQRARVKRGRTPLADYWQLDIRAAAGLYSTTLKARPDPASARGGHHRSPIQHDRRGHQRRLRSGKVTWVRSCQVGVLQRHLTRKRDYYRLR